MPNAIEKEIIRLEKESVELRSSIEALDRKNLGRGLAPGYLEERKRQSDALVARKAQIHRLQLDQNRLEEMRQQGQGNQDWRDDRYPPPPPPLFNTHTQGSGILSNISFATYYKQIQDKALEYTVGPVFQTQNGYSAKVFHIGDRHYSPVLVCRIEEIPGGGITAIPKSPSDFYATAEALVRAAQPGQNFTINPGEGADNLKKALEQAIRAYPANRGLTIDGVPFGGSRNPSQNNMARFTRGFNDGWKQNQYQQGPFRQGQGILSSQKQNRAQNRGNSPDPMPYQFKNPRRGI